MKTGTSCGAWAHSERRSPYDVPSSTRSSCLAGTWVGTRDAWREATQRLGSSTILCNKRRTSFEARAWRRELVAKNSSDSGIRRYGTVRKEMSSSQSAWPSASSKLGSSRMCNTSSSVSTCDGSPRELGLAPDGYFRPERLSCGAMCPWSLARPRTVSPWRLPRATTLNAGLCFLFW